MTNRQQHIQLPLCARISFTFATHLYQKSRIKEKGCRMQPLQRLSAFLRQQLFLMSKRASFTSATSLIPPSRISTTT